MTITDIKIRKLIDEGKVRAVVSVTFDDSLVCHDIRVIAGEQREFIATPSRRTSDGTFIDIVHPINSAFRTFLEESVLKAYHEELDRRSQQQAPGE
ncbi:septation regulator SpoVG [Feifania hominis]|uniref:Septation regulator SpoVG n=1 Tax=Feifania hominis TaxID=2763660 RepID=A0A926DBP2_9FIRM|nr:septation regulator SpoVG [Feifania hominis]